MFFVIFKQSSVCMPNFGGSNELLKPSLCQNSSGSDEKLESLWDFK